MRALTSLSTILTLALGLGACGDDGGTTKGSGPTTNQPETTGETTTNSSVTDVGPTTGNPTEAATSTGGLTTVTTGATTEESSTTMNVMTGGTTEGSDTTAGTTEGSDTTAGDTDSSTGDTTTGGAGDPNWPAPDPMNMKMPCEADFVAASFSMGGLVCSPECGAMDKCPKGATGDAQAACVFNPTSSGKACMKMGDMCPNMDEECVMTGGGGMACLAPSDHCVLLCTGGETCPDGMECFDKLICQYPV